VTAEASFGFLDPPNSARPNILKLRRTAKMMKARTATIVNTVIEKAKLPGCTLNTPPFAAWYELASTQGSPRPRKTLTELLPVMLPMALSACFSWHAAALLANKSGKLVPNATNVIADNK